MKQREARRAVMIDARLRQPTGWTDARILNISSRGLMVHASTAPRRGTYVEICRGSYRIVARVVWTEEQRFGVSTQDLLPVDSITRGIDAAPAPGGQAAERRSASGTQRPTSSAERHEKSRQRSRTFQYACGVALGMGAAAIAFEAITQALSRPLAMVSSTLGG